MIISLKTERGHGATEMEDMGPGEVRERKGGDCDQNALYKILKELTKSCFLIKEYLRAIETIH